MAGCFFREVPDALRIENIAAQRSRHLKMIADEATYCLALLRVEFKPREETLCQLDALRTVVTRAARFACIVHEEREQEEVEAINFRQQRSKAFFPVVSGLAQPVHVVDDEKGMLIDGVAVVRVTDDERVDTVELGNDQLEDAESMHRAQRMRGMGSEQDLS